MDPTAQSSDKSSPVGRRTIQNLARWAGAGNTDAEKKGARNASRRRRLKVTVSVGDRATVFERHASWLGFRGFDKHHQAHGTAARPPCVASRRLACCRRAARSTGFGGQSTAVVARRGVVLVRCAYRITASSIADSNPSTYLEHHPQAKTRRRPPWRASTRAICWRACRRIGSWGSDTAPGRRLEARPTLYGCR